MFYIAYAFKGHVHVFAGQVKTVSHSSCRTSAILKYFCPLCTHYKKKKKKENKKECVKPTSTEKGDVTVNCKTLLKKVYA